MSVIKWDYISVGLERYRIGDLLLDAGTQEVKRKGIVVPVPRLSFKLLLSLARHAPNVVSVQQLEREVWQGLVVDRGTINKRVMLLRKALSTDECDDPYIAVIRGSGYRLITEVERLHDFPGEMDLEIGNRKGTGRQNPTVLRKTAYWLLAIVAVLAVYFGSMMATSKIGESDRVETVPPGTQSQPLKFSQTTVAVLPFVDLSDGKVHQYLGDGIAEEIINLLASMDGLEVAARTSSFAFRDTELTAMEIAPKLRVGTVLEGSLRHFDDRIRVTAQLIDAQTGYHIWSQNYDRTFDEIFEVQDDMALQIAQSLKLTIDESTTINSRHGTTADMEAFELYLKGRELFNSRIEGRASGLRKAREFFSEAVDKDPGFARAHGGIALVSRLLTSYDDTLDKETYLQYAETSAKLALELDPTSIDALSALALVYETRGDIVRAAAMYEQIRTIGSNDSNVMHWEAMLHIRLGYFEVLIKPLTEVYRLEPTNEHIGWSLASALNFSGDPAPAMRILKELNHFTYRQYVLGLCAINSGDFSLARELLRDVKMRSGTLPATYADLLIDAIEEPAKSEKVAGQILAAVEKGKLTKTVAFESLLILGSPHVFDLGIDPRSDFLKLQIHTQVWNNWAVAVRQDPRFKEWVTILGNVEFWKKYGWPDRCRPTGQDDFECI